MGQRKKFVVRLAEDEKRQLTAMTRQGSVSARVMTRARLLLLADEQLKDRDVAQRLGLCSLTVSHIRRKYVEGGLQAALYEQARPKQAPKLDPKATAILIAETCSDPPTGRASWTMQLLADRLVVLGVVDQISDETVRKTLKKTS